MIEPVRFNVLGNPATQGSMQPFNDKSGRARVRHSGGTKLKNWRTDVANAAKDERRKIGVTMDGPLKLEIAFRVPMPASRPMWMKQQGIALCIVPPDLDKLVRAVGDACKDGGLIRDDALFAIERLSKLEVWDSWHGAAIRISMLDQRTFRGEL